MLVENAQMVRQGTATVQEFRSEVHGAAQRALDEAQARRELEERRIDIDERLLEHTKKVKVLESGKKDDEDA